MTKSIERSTWDNRDNLDNPDDHNNYNNHNRHNHHTLIAEQQISKTAEKGGPIDLVDPLLTPHQIKQRS